MAITVVFPLPAQGMVVVPGLQRLIFRESNQDGCQDGIQRLSVPTLGFTLVISFELASAFNRAHAGRP